MFNILTRRGTDRRKNALFVLLTVAATAIVLTGCKTNSWPEQIEGQPAIISTPDYGKKTVADLVKIFTTHHDGSEALYKTSKELDSWGKAHPGVSSPVILHSEQSDAAYELIQRGPQAKEAAPAMIQSLVDTNFMTRHWAIQVLQAIGPASSEIVPALVNVLHNDDTGYEAAQVLIGFSVTDTNVLPAVIAKIESGTESPPAQNSVRVLDGIGADARGAVPALIQLLEHTNSCDLVMSALCAIGPDAAPAVPSLLRYYDSLRGDGYFPQRKWAVITLGRIGPAAKEAVPMLLKRLGPYVAIDSARALWRIDPQYTQLAVKAAQGEIQQYSRNFWNSDAIALLGQIGPPAKSMVPLLLQALDSPPNQQIAFNVAWAIWQIDPDQKAKVIEVFENLRQHGGSYPFTDLPMDAAGALWQIEPERRDELRPIILAALKNGDMRIGWAEMSTLQPALMDIADNPKYADFHLPAILLLRQIKGARAECWAR